MAIGVIMPEIFQGLGGSVEVNETGIIIRRKGFYAFAMHGFKGDKHIPFGSISAVQLKPAGTIIDGYIQFSVKGGLESIGALKEARRDENSVVFQKKSDNVQFERLRDLVQAGIIAARGTAVSTPSSDIVDQLTKLADLLDRGLLNREEFEAQKVKLIG